MNNYYIYFYYHDKKIIYIGKTINLKQRIYQHGRESTFIQYCKDNNIFYTSLSIKYFECNCEEKMNKLERLFINKYKPELNIKDKNNCNDNSIEIDISEFEWSDFETKTLTEKDYSNLYCLLKRFGEEAKENDDVDTVSKCIALAQDVQKSYNAMCCDSNKPIWAFKQSGLGRKAVYTDLEEKILALHHEGLSLRKIAEKCGCSTRPVRDTLAKSKKESETFVFDTDLELKRLNVWVDSKRQINGLGLSIY